MNKIKRIFATVMSLTIMMGASGITAYAEDTDSFSEQTTSKSDEYEGLFDNASYSCRKNGTMRIHGSDFTPEGFDLLAMTYTPKYIWILSIEDITGDEETVNEWFKNITTGGFGIECVCIMTNGDSGFLDKYNRMIESELNEAQAKGENVTETDLRMKYKLFTFDKKTQTFTYPDGSVCENCHYVNVLVMKDYPNNTEPIAAEFIVEGTPTVRGDVNGDSIVNARDCAHIANCLSKHMGYDLPDSADYNQDGKKDIRDAAAISRDLANRDNS